MARSAYPALDRLMLKHMVEIISHKRIIVKPVGLKKRQRLRLVGAKCGGMVRLQKPRLMFKNREATQTEPEQLQLTFAASFVE